MKIVLLLTILAAGMQNPLQSAKDMPNMEACEAAAHEFNVTKIDDPDMLLASAACLRVSPRLKDPGHAL